MATATLIPYATWQPPDRWLSKVTCPWSTSSSVDYNSLFARATPALLLAPMEQLGDCVFRRALASTVGGFDEACTEFIRVADQSDHPERSAKGVAKRYVRDELGSVPLAAQIMGSNPEMCARVTHILGKVKGAPRVDLNCGCPANTVTGKGAGSSLLRTPEKLGATVEAMVKAAQGSFPVTVKMRSGFLDISLFKENLLAAQEGGASFVTVHPRTKKEGYRGRANWDLIREAKSLLKIPVVGNGDVTSPEDAEKLLKETKCDAIMIGRGAVQDPLIFWKIKAKFIRNGYEEGRDAEIVTQFVKKLIFEHQKECEKRPINPELNEKGKSRRLKQVAKYLFRKNGNLLEALPSLLRLPDNKFELLEEEAVLLIGKYWNQTNNGVK